MRNTNLSRNFSLVFTVVFKIWNANLDGFWNLKEYHRFFNNHHVLYFTENTLDYLTSFFTFESGSLDSLWIWNMKEKM
jgi:hypothetical protein